MKTVIDFLKTAKSINLLILTLFAFSILGLLIWHFAGIIKSMHLNIPLGFWYLFIFSLFLISLGKFYVYPSIKNKEIAKNTNDSKKLTPAKRIELLIYPVMLLLVANIAFTNYKADTSYLLISQSNNNTCPSAVKGETLSASAELEATLEEKTDSDTPVSTVNDENKEKIEEKPKEEDTLTDRIKKTIVDYFLDKVKKNI